MSKQKPNMPPSESRAYLASIFPKLTKEEICLLEIQIGDFLMTLHQDYTASKRKDVDLTNGDDVLA